MKMRHLLASTSAIALTFAVMHGIARADDDNAADGIDVTTGATVTNGSGTTADGILIDGGGAFAITIDPDGNMTLGADGVHEGITINNGGGTTVDINVIDSAPGSANTLTFEGDIGQDSNETTTLDVQTGAVTFEGDIEVAAGTLTVNAGSGSADPTIALTFNIATNENLAIGAAIQAVDAADTVNITITDAEGTASNTVAFSQAIGGTTAANAVDSITVDANTEGTTATFAQTVNTGAFSVLGDADGGEAASATVTGAFTAAGATAVTAGSGSGANAELTLSGNVAATGAITVTGGGHADADATLTLNGATIANAGGIALDDVTGQSFLVFSGAAAQSVSGAITAASDNDGEISVGNNVDTGVTFNGAIGANSGNAIGHLNIGSNDGTPGTAAADAVFNSTVHADEIDIDADGGATTADFNGVVEVGGTGVNIEGGAQAAENATASFSSNIIGDGVITLDDEVGVVVVNFDGATAQTIAGDITAANAGDATINVSNAAGVTHTGRLGATAIGALNIADGATFTLDTDNGAGAVNTITLGDDDGADGGTFVIDSTDAGGDFTLTGAIAANDDAAGTFRATGTQNVIVTGNVGVDANNDLAALELTGVATGKGVTFQEDFFGFNVAIDATNATDENTVTFGAGGGDVAQISGAITVAENDEHTIVFMTSDGDVAGAVGANGAALKGLTVDAADGAADADFAGNVFTGTLSVVADTNAGNAATSTITGNLTSSGAVAVTGGTGDNAGANASLEITGNVVSSGSAFTVTAGANEDEDATLTLSGASIATNGVTLNESTNGDAVVLFNGGAAQSVSGAILANDDGEGSVYVGQANGGGVTFANNIGANGGNSVQEVFIGSNNGVGGSTAGGAIFNGTVSAELIDLDAHTAASTADFNGALEIGANHFTIEGGDGAGENATATIAGDVLGSNDIILDKETGEAIVTFDGAAAQAVAADLAAAQAGDGVVNVTNTHASGVTVAGQIGQTAAIGAVNIADGSVFTVTVDATANAVNTITLGDDDGSAGGTFVFGATGSIGDTTLTGAIAANDDGAGIFRVQGTDTVIVTGNVGVDANNDLQAIQVVGLANSDGLTLQGNTYAESVAIDATGATDENTVTFGNGGGDITAIGGAITSAENDEHTLVFNSGGGAAVTGNVGANGAAFKLVDVDANASFGGAVYATQLDGANGASVTFNGSGANVFGGAIINDADLITAGTDMRSFTGAVAADTLTVNANSGAIFNSTAQINEAIAVTGTLQSDVATGVVLSGAGTVTLNDGAILRLSTAHVNNSVLINADAGNADAVVLGAANATITVDTTNTGLTDGQTLELISGAGTDELGANLDEDAEVTAAFQATGGTEFYYEISRTDANVILTARAWSAANITTQAGGNLTSEEASTTVTALGLVDGTALETAVDAIFAAGAKAVEDFAKSATVDEGVIAAGNTSAVFDAAGAAGATIDVAAAEGLETGLAAGDHVNGYRAWLQAFGAVGDQDERDGVDGFDTGTIGTAAGVDRLFNGGDGIAGLAFSYAFTNVESDGVGGAESDINSYMFTAYADHKLPRGFKVDGRLGFAVNDIETDRTIVGAGVNAEADFNSYLIVGSVGVEREIPLQQGFTITPRAGIEVNHLIGEDYTETGAGVLNSSVGDDDVTAIKLEFGGRVEKEFETQRGSVTPFVSAFYVPELLGQNFETTAAFTGGGSSFAVEGFDPAQQEAKYSIGLEVEMGDLDVSASYDGRAKADYIQHGGQVRFRWAF